MLDWGSGNFNVNVLSYRYDFPSEMRRGFNTVFSANHSYNGMRNLLGN